jgi:DNA-binding MarR family transcriptional regulator
MMVHNEDTSLNERDALDKVLHLTMLLTEDMNQALAKLGLTASRTQLLWELQQRGPATQRELAQALRVSARNVTGLVDGLVSTGFVTREPHPADRRAIHVKFTEQGAKTMAVMEKEHRELAKLLFGDLPNLKIFASGLDHVLARLTAELSKTAELNK